MRGNATYYTNEVHDKKKQLQKLNKAKNKYQRIVEDIQREIEQTQRMLDRDIHCLQTVTADTWEKVESL